MEQAAARNQGIHETVCDSTHVWYLAALKARPPPLLVTTFLSPIYPPLLVATSHRQAYRPGHADWNISYTQVPSAERLDTLP